jgi:mRNA deadenylase 3'-5' endonuclease subunit Ccr4
VDEGHPDLREDALHVLPPAHELAHGLNMISCYADVTGVEPPYTNVTAGFTGVLDYIWCSANHIRPLAVVPVPDKANLEKVGGALPNVQVKIDRSWDELHFLPLD